MEWMAWPLGVLLAPVGHHTEVQVTLTLHHHHEVNALQMHIHFSYDLSIPFLLLPFSFRFISVINKPHKDYCFSGLLGFISFS